jgi:hypothetical protein
MDDGLIKFNQILIWFREADQKQAHEALAMATVIMETRSRYEKPEAPAPENRKGRPPGSKNKKTKPVATVVEMGGAA